MGRLTDRGVMVPQGTDMRPSPDRLQANGDVSTRWEASPNEDKTEQDGIEQNKDRGKSNSP